MTALIALKCVRERHTQTFLAEVHIATNFWEKNMVVPTKNKLCYKTNKNTATMPTQEKQKSEKSMHGKNSISWAKSPHFVDTMH